MTLDFCRGFVGQQLWKLFFFWKELIGRQRKKNLLVFRRNLLVCNGSWPCLRKGIGLQNLQRTLPNKIILWFCRSQECFVNLKTQILLSDSAPNFASLNFLGIYQVRASSVFMLIWVWLNLDWSQVIIYACDNPPVNECWNANFPLFYIITSNSPLIFPGRYLFHIT